MLLWSAGARRLASRFDEISGATGPHPLNAERPFPLPPILAKGMPSIAKKRRLATAILPWLAPRAQLGAVTRMVAAAILAAVRHPCRPERAVNRLRMLQHGEAQRRVEAFPPGWPPSRRSGAVARREGGEPGSTAGKDACRYGAGGKLRQAHLTSSPGARPSGRFGIRRD